MSEETCLLCLEQIDDSTGKIDIDSVEGRAQEMQQIIEKYFKEQLNDAFSSMTTHLVCRPCWHAVSTFHEFCLRVQRAHLASLNILRLSGTCEIVTIKEECDISEEAPLDAAPKRRRRGRSRKQTAAESTIDMHELPECKVVIEKIDMSCLENKKEIQIPIVEDTIKLENNINVEDIKHEALQEECIDADYTADDTDSDYMAPKDCLNDSDTDLNKIEQTSKVKTKPKSKKSAEIDEYIAQHFKLSCCLCDSPLANFSELKTHFKAQHRTLGYVRCCGKKLLNRTELVDHIHLHLDPDYFKCTRCGKSMSDRRCLELHIKNHDRSHERIYKCDICPKSFFRQSILMRHVVTHMPDEQRKHACPQCDKTFPTHYLMNQHLKLVHLNLYAKICDVCGKSIKGREALRRHMDEHAGVINAPIQCELCNTIVTNKYALTQHKKTMHTEKYRTPQTCPICLKELASVRTYKHHMNYMHELEPKHACTMCDKVFKRPSHLKEHMCSHTGQALYTCGFCPKMYTSDATLCIHRKKKHPVEWEESRRKRELMRGRRIDKPMQNESQDDESSKS